MFSCLPGSSGFCPATLERRALVARLLAVLAERVFDLPFPRVPEAAGGLRRARVAGESPRPFIEATILCSASSGMPCF